MSYNWRNYNKKLKLSLAKNARNIKGFFSKQKKSEKSEEVDEQNENRPLNSDAVINFIKQSESKPTASTSCAESQFTHVPKSETWF